MSQVVAAPSGWGVSIRRAGRARHQAGRDSGRLIGESGAGADGFESIGREVS